MRAGEESVVIRLLSEQPLESTEAFVQSVRFPVVLFRLFFEEFQLLVNAGDESLGSFRSSF